MPTTVVLADDHTVMRKAIAGLLHTDPGIQILAQASTFAQTLELVSKLHPHILVLDLHMKDEMAMTTAQLNSGLKGSRILAISIWNDDETKSFAKAIGADVLLDKSNLADELIPAIHNCANNRTIELLLDVLEAGALD
jgi:DNA-binding NarL/FixJ family response regulator